MNSTPKVQFHGEQLDVSFQRYHDGHLCVRLTTPDGMPYMTASTNVALPNGRQLAPDEMIVKNYSENTGILDALERAGVIAPTGWVISSGQVMLDVRKVLVLKE